MCLEGGITVPLLYWLQSGEIWGLLKNSASGCFHCKRLAGDGRKSRSKHRRMWDRTEHQWGAGQGKPGQVEAKWGKPAQYCGRLAHVSLFASILWHIGSRLTFWHNIVTGYPSTHFWKIKNLTCKVGQSAAPDMCKPNALVSRILNPGGQLVDGAFYVCVGHNWEHCRLRIHELVMLSNHNCRL